MSGNAGTARGGTIFNSGESVDSTGASSKFLLARAMYLSLIVSFQTSLALVVHPAPAMSKVVTPSGSVPSTLAPLVVMHTPVTRAARRLALCSTSASRMGSRKVMARSQTLRPVSKLSPPKGFELT